MYACSLESFNANHWAKDFKTKGPDSQLYKHNSSQGSFTVNPWTGNLFAKFKYWVSLFKSSDQCRSGTLYFCHCVSGKPLICSGSELPKMQKWKMVLIALGLAPKSILPRSPRELSSIASHVTLCVPTIIHQNQEWCWVHLHCPTLSINYLWNGAQGIKEEELGPICSLQGIGAELQNAQSSFQ